MKAAIDDDRCCGHATCVTLCPEVFALTDDGYAEVQIPEIPAQFEKVVRDAVANCPEHAVTAY